MKPLLKIIFFVLIAVCCSDDPEILTNNIDSNASYKLSLISGSNQTGLQTKLLSEPIIIQVKDSEDQSVGNIEISVNVVEGGGRILNNSLITNNEGLLEIIWELGEEVNNKIEVSIAGNNEDVVSATARTKYLYKTPEQDDDGWEVASLDTSNSKFQKIFDGIDAIRYGTYTEVHSCLIVHKGKFVFEIYFPGHNSNGTFINFNRFIKHEVQSASKSFRSALIGIAIDKGFISGVDKKLYSFFPEYSHLNNEQKQEITLEDVLTMSSGLNWDEWSYSFSDSRNTLSTMYSLPYNNWLGYVLSRPVQYEHGTQFVYNTGASIMLNNIIVNSINTSFSNFVRQYYSSLLDSRELPGVGSPLGATTLPRDMAKLGFVFLNDGKWKDTRVVSKEWIEKSIQKKFQFSSGEGYGYQWWLRTFQTPTNSYESFYAAGNGGQFIIIIKELELVIVFTGGHFGSSLMQKPLEIVSNNIIPAFQ